ncbi:MAG: hypothetical protein A2V93_04480 [Ignavibacteria bacterium RBG_16_34_14]|nr:MAG: hypothetical protein A2V93_04480 [Ignavibacteria bacterium RBG_16_34_14]
MFGKSEIGDPESLGRYIKIVDIDSDGMNEFLITNESDSGFPGIKCYSYEGDPIWQYSFHDKVSSMREELPPVYNLFFLDTLMLNEHRSLLMIANNSPSFSSAIFRVDLKTGKRLPGTLWSSGHSVNGIIKDINGDGKKDVLCVGVDNGYEDAVLFGFDIDTTTRVRPTTNEYLILDFPVAKLITYIRFPKTDYDEYRNFRMPGPFQSSFQDVVSNKYYQFYTMDFLNDFSSILWYQISYNLKDVSIVVDSRFRVMRDSLVAHGELKPPYTDTPEYINLQKSKILYWLVPARQGLDGKDGKWVKRAELEK